MIEHVDILTEDNGLTEHLLVVQKKRNKLRSYLKKGKNNK